MPAETHSERELRDLTAVADGAPAAAPADRPETAALLERQRIAVAALRAVDVRAPDGLRERIGASRPGRGRAR